MAQDDWSKPSTDGWTFCIGSELEPLDVWFKGVGDGPDGDIDLWESSVNEFVSADLGPDGLGPEAPYIVIGIASIMSLGTVSRLIPSDSRSISPAAIRRRRSRLARYCEICIEILVLAMIRPSAANITSRKSHNPGKDEPWPVLMVSVRRT